MRAAPAGGFAPDESLFVRFGLLILCYCFDGEVFLDFSADECSRRLMLLLMNDLVGIFTHPFDNLSCTLKTLNEEPS